MPMPETNHIRNSRLSTMPSQRWVRITHRRISPNMAILETSPEVFDEHQIVDGSIDARVEKPSTVRRGGQAETNDAEIGRQGLRRTCRQIEILEARIARRAVGHSDTGGTGKAIDVIDAV